MAYQTINEANKAVVQKMIGAAPFLTDVVPAHTVIPELTEHVLLHADRKSTRLNSSHRLEPRMPTSA